jgi:hypothetical protein
MIIIKNKAKGKEYPITEEDWEMMKRKGKSKLFTVVGTIPDRPVKPLGERPKPRVPDTITQVLAEKKKGSDAPKASK